MLFKPMWTCYKEQPEATGPMSTTN